MYNKKRRHFFVMSPFFIHIKIKQNKRRLQNMKTKDEIMLEPKKTFIGIKIQPSLSEMIKNEAKKDMRSVSNWFQELVMEYFENKNKIQ